MTDRHLRDMMQHRKERGSFDGDVDEFCDSVVRNIGREKASHSIIQCADGRTLLTVRKPLADGGWVTTMEDITERRNLEQEREDRKSTRLNSSHLGISYAVFC